MTETQVKYWDYRESKRHNLVTESQGERRLVSDIALNRAHIRKAASDIMVNDANIRYTNMRTQLTASEIQKTDAQTGNIKADTRLKEVQAGNVQTDTQLKTAQISKTEAETHLTNVKITNTKADTAKKKAETSKVKAETSKVKAETQLTKAKITTELAKGSLTQKQLENYVLDQLNKGGDFAKGIATIGYCAELGFDETQMKTVKEKAFNTVVNVAKSIKKGKSVAKVAYQNGVPAGIIANGILYASGQAIVNWFKKLVKN